MKKLLDSKTAALLLVGLASALESQPVHADMNRVEFFRSDSCRSEMIGMIGSYTDCRAFAGSSVWGVSVNGVCKNIEDMDGAKACERFRALANRNEYDLIQHYRSDSCSSSLVAVQDPYSGPELMNSSDSVWAVSYQGRCHNLEDTSLSNAVNRVRGLFAPEFDQVIFHRSDSCNGSVLAIVDRKQGCSSVGSVSEQVWGISEGGRCTNISDDSFNAVCGRFAGAPYPGNPPGGPGYPGNPPGGPGYPGGPGHGGPGHGTDLYYSRGPIGRGPVNYLGDTGLVGKMRMETRTVFLQPRDQREFFEGLQLSARDDVFHVERLIVVFGNGETATLGSIDIRENDIVWVDFESRRGRREDERRVREVTVIGNAGNPFGSKARLEILGITSRDWGRDGRPGRR